MFYANDFPTRIRSKVLPAEQTSSAAPSWSFLINSNLTNKCLLYSGLLLFGKHKSKIRGEMGNKLAELPILVWLGASSDARIGLLESTQSLLGLGSFVLQLAPSETLRNVWATYQRQRVTRARRLIAGAGVSYTRCVVHFQLSLLCRLTLD